MSERKNVLFTLFFLASLISYIKYVKSKRTAAYYLALVLFILSILSKVTAITLAFSIILVDFFFERKLLNKKVILEKIPFIILAIIFGIVATKAQEFTWGNSDLETTSYSFIVRILFAASSFVLYILKSIIPFKLSAFYPYPQNTEFLTIFKYGLYLIPAILVVIAGIYSLKKNRVIFFGLVFFMVNIAMLLKVFEVPAGNYIMADRYAYVPSIGLYLIMGYFVHYLYTRFTNKKIVIIAFSILYFTIIGLQTNKYIKVWKNDISLFSSIIKNHPEVSIAWNNRGLAKKDAGNLQGAINDLSKVIELTPDKVSAYSNRGNLFAQMGEHKKAIADYNKIIELLPSDSMAYFNRAVSKAEIKNWNEAIRDYDYAILKMPKNSMAYMNRGVAYASISNFNSAIENFNLAIKLDSSYANAWFNRGIAYAKLNDFDNAITDFDQAIERNANYINAYFSRSIAKEYKQDFYGAIEDLSSIIKINPRFAPAYAKRGYIRIYLKDFDGCNDLRQAEQLGMKINYPKGCGEN
jgi:tetratricopeptide (TPR) repeat protein